MSVFSRIGSAMRRYPLVTASTQCSLLMVTGDLISQTLIEKKSASEIDLVRTGRFGLVGFVVVGPVLSKWYGFLQTRIVLKSPALSTIAKVSVDQGFFAPIFLFSFMGFMGALNGRSQEQIKEDIRRDYLDIMIKNYQLWPAAQMINFSIVPVQHRVLFAQSVALLWNTYLSFKINRPSDSGDTLPIAKGKDGVKSLAAFE